MEINFTMSCNSYQKYQIVHECAVPSLISELSLKKRWAGYNLFGVTEAYCLNVVLNVTSLDVCLKKNGVPSVLPKQSRTDPLIKAVN